MQEERKCIICGTPYIRNIRYEVCSTECSKQRTRYKCREWYAKNKEYSNKKSREYAVKNKLRRSEYNKKYAEENSDELAKKRRIRRDKDPERFKKEFADWYIKNKDRQREKAKKYRLENPDKVRIAFGKWQKKKLKTCPYHKIKHTLRNRISSVLRGIKAKKYVSTETLLGCTYYEFIDHMQSLFIEGMTWENHGKWHVDHIIPCAVFDLTEQEEQKKCFHYSNLQPLWAADNIRKSDKLI